MGCFDNAHGDCKWGYGEEADVQAEDDEKKIFWGPRNVEVTETEDIFDPYFFLLARGDGEKMEKNGEKLPKIITTSR
jgi:hypothetical protein